MTGVVPIQVSSGDDSLTSVIAFLSSDTSTKVTLTYQGGGVWSGSIDASSAPAGTALVIRAVSVSGFTTERITYKEAPPGAIATPMAGSRLASPVFAVRRSNTGLDFTVRLNTPGSVDLEVCTLDGRRVWSSRMDRAAAGQYRAHLNTEKKSVPRGTYLVRVKAPKRTVSRKITLF
jgi:hypothetical protein